MLYLRAYAIQSPLGHWMQYLHARRRIPLAKRVEYLAFMDEYYHWLAEAADEFARSVRSAGMWDVLIQAPSDDACSDPYFARLAVGLGGARMARQLWIKPKEHSAGADETADALATYQAIKWRDPVLPDCSQLSNVLIIDDVFAAGKTVAATWAHLLTFGLPLTAKVTVAVPLLV